ncbi:hypothetical protein [Vibrio lentus]|uniref:hypothetical protein n=1 Tax=Vibrio lentus TaxID=136468 RepID=UPI003D10FC6A
MNQLQAIPTTHGLSVLTSTLKSSVKKFKLLGNIGPQAANVYEFHSEKIHASYYDANGVLTFEMRLPIETHFNEYMYKVHIVDDAGAVVIECDTPKVALPKGIGGMLTLKSTVTGTPGDLVFQNSDYLTETEFMARFASKMQAMPYDPLRAYSAGETCYTKDAQTGELSYWQWYSNVESLPGKDPLVVENRQNGWSDDTKPFYWSPYKKARTGTALFPWMSMTFPEGTLNVIGNSVPVAVFWRLAAALPEFVNVGTGMIDFPETRGEFFRVLEQARGVDLNRAFGSYQNDLVKEHGHTVDYQNITAASGSGVTVSRFVSYGGLDKSTSLVGGVETRSRNLAFPILVEV